MGNFFQGSIFPERDVEPFFFEVASSGCSSHLNRHIFNTVNLKKDENLKSINKIKIQLV